MYICKENILIGVPPFGRPPLKLSQAFGISEIVPKAFLHSNQNAPRAYMHQFKNRSVLKPVSNIVGIYVAR